MNRVWLEHFGRGLVGTPSDFATMGERPSHPELLDRLVSDFRARLAVEAAAKIIMTSTAYRQSSHRIPARQRDPENRLYWRKPIQRLDAEVIRDAILSQRRVQRKDVWPAVPVRPDAWPDRHRPRRNQRRQQNAGRVPLNGEEFRRGFTSSGAAVRSRCYTLRRAGDGECRQSSTVATQSLMLMNSQFMLGQAARFAQRLQKEFGDDRAGQITRGWQLAFSRSPTEPELTDALSFLSRQADHLKTTGEQEASETKDVKKDEKPKKDEKAMPAPKPAPELQALTDLCQALLSANEFLYVD